MKTKIFIIIGFLALWCGNVIFCMDLNKPTNIISVVVDETGVKCSSSKPLTIISHSSMQKILDRITYCENAMNSFAFYKNGFLSDMMTPK